MRSKIKICGLTRIEDIAAVNELMPDYIGFVFWEKSKRNVTEATARFLKNNLHKQIQAVGVFVDPDIDMVCNLLEDGTIDIAQLHGSEDADYIMRVKERTGRPVIKAFNMNRISDPGEIEDSPADYVMLDSGKGSGQTFDWEKIKMIKRPFFLAGGLDPDNISEVLKNYTPYAVDVSSGVETDGYKDKNKMRQFILNCGALGLENKS